MPGQPSEPPVYEDKHGDHWVRLPASRWERVDLPTVVLDEAEAVARYGVSVSGPDQHGARCIWARIRSG